MAQVRLSGQDFSLWDLEPVVQYMAQVRLSGQDSSRGTFNQRHTVLYNQTNSKQYMPLNNIMPGYQDRMLALDSPLSEVGVGAALCPNVSKSGFVAR
jgi:2-oxoglutarate dehydrogenase complex dehydrogenase (E1) component-like enzyme